MGEKKKKRFYRPSSKHIPLPCLACARMINCSYFLQRRAPLYHPYNIFRRSLISPARGKHDSARGSSPLRSPNEILPPRRRAALINGPPFQFCCARGLQIPPSDRQTASLYHYVSDNGARLSASNGAGLPVDAYRLAPVSRKKKVRLSPLLRRCYQLGLRVWLPPAAYWGPRAESFPRRRNHQLAQH